jgi:predicted permease
VSEADREFLLDDLEDGYRARRARRQSAVLWYLAQGAHAAWTRRRPVSLADPSTVPMSATGAFMPTAVTADLRSAWRSFRRQPGITAAVVLSLGLGIGTASAMFSVVRAVLIAPLPYAQSDRLVTVWSKWTNFDRTWLATKDVLDFKAGSRAIEDMAMWSSGRVTLTGVGDAARVNTGYVTSNTFSVLGAKPIMGRTFTEDEAIADAKSGHSMFVVLSYNLWHGTFGADPGIVGREIRLNDRPVTVTGVMPPHFQLPTDFTEEAAEPTLMWAPFYNDPKMADRDGHGYYGAARLRAGATLEQFNADLASMTAEFTRSGGYPVQMHFTAFAETIDHDVLGAVRPSMRVLLAAVTLLLLIACANAAALLVARAEARRREWTTRVALGASRWRLLRLQFVEGLVLAMTGGALGITLALLAKRALDAIGPTAIPRASEVTVDWRVMAFMFGVSAVAAIVCSLAPAVHAIKLNVVDGLKDGNTNASAGRGRLRLRALLVVAQLSMGLLLVAGASLMGRTLYAMRQIDLGLKPEGVLTARVSLPSSRYSKPEQVDGYMDTLLTRLRALPGVSAVGIVRSLPIGSTIGDRGLMVEGFQGTPGQNQTGDWQVATPGAVEALGERLVRGRLFKASDVAGAPAVALVNESMAAAYWPGLDPVGRRIRFGGMHSAAPWVTVIGVVGNVHHNSLIGTVKTKFYLPYSQFPTSTGASPIGGGTIVMRTSGDPMALVGSLRSTAAAVDRDVPIAAVRPMTEVVDTALTAPRLTSQVMIGFAVVALLLSAIGLFGLLVYLVAQRTQEIGIRMAIGADTRMVVQFIFREGLRITLVGVAIGLVLSALAVRGVSSLLYGVTPWDPISWVVAPAVLLGVAAIACIVPALRAAAIDPLRALRQV